MIFLKNLIVSAVFSLSVLSFAWAESDARQNVNDVFAPVNEAWHSVREAIASPRLSNAEKSATVDHLFDTLQAVCTENCDWIAERLKASKSSPQEPVVEGEAVETPSPSEDNPPDSTASSAAERFLLSGSKKDFANRLNLAIQLVRQVVHLEENKIFDLMSDGDNRPRQFKTSAELATDMHFLFRQGVALARLFQIGYEAAQSGIQLINTDAADPKTFLKSADFHKAFDDVFPQLLKSVDDLGLYYAKLVQAFSALVFHFSPEAYDKISYFLGRMPKKMSFQQVREIIEADLGQPLEDLYVEFDREPFSNGSMAQVHRAKIRDRRGRIIPVVVKVQKDFVVQELEWNMKTNDIFFDFLEGITPDDAKWLVRFLTGQGRELGLTFKNELDFPAEAYSQEKYRILLSTIAHHHVPKVIRSLVGARVITAEEVCNSKRIDMVFVGTAACQKPAEAEATSAKKASGIEAKSDPAPEHQAPSQVLAPSPKASSASADETEDIETIGKQPDVATMSFGELFMTLSRKYKYEIGPQYLQFIRSAIPAISIAVHLNNLKSNLQKQGKDGNDPDIQHLDQMMNSLTQAFFYQVIYMKELHADYNWGNVLVDPVFDLSLFDFANTVSTKGLVLRPGVLALAFFKGDAPLVVKKLSQIGVFPDFAKNREEITALVQSYMDAKGIERQTWRGLLKDWKAEFKQSKAKKKAAAVVTDPPTVSADPKPTSLRALRQAQQAQQNSAAAPSAEATASEAKSPSGAMSDLKVQGLKVGMQFVKMSFSYPYHRTRVRVLRGLLHLRYPCEKMLRR